MNMAKKNDKNVKEYIIHVENNEKFVGVGAGGVQFANGKATVTSERMANWFREHRGYKVEEILEQEAANPES